jgi:hypothetical protein
MSLSTIKAKVKTWIGKLTEPIENPDYADYYNGSENELENIFLEIQKVLAQSTNVFNINNHKIRLDFLANEGLNIISFSEKPKSFKVTPKEADELILTLSKKAKPQKAKKVTKKKSTKTK